MTVTAPPRPPRPSDPVDREEVEALVEALIEEARQRARRRRRRNLAVATTIAIVGAVVFTGLVRSAQSQPASQALSARSSHPAATGESKIAFIREPFRGGYAGVLWVMNPDGSGQRKLSPELAHELSWSADGQKLAYDGVHLINVDGSGQQTLTEGAEPVWSPDGGQIAFAREGDSSSHVFVIEADGSQERLLASVPRQIGDRVEPAWSPRGDKIAFVGRPGSNLEIYVMNPDGTGQRRLTHNTVRDSHPVWSPDGEHIAYENNWQLWVMNADGSGQRRLTYNGGRNFNPAWSPDGQRIAFERRVGRYQEVDWCSGCGGALFFQVHVIYADGSGERQLTPDGARNRAPSWSPDGRKIAFVSNRNNGNQEIYVMNADGSGQRNLTRTR